VVPLPLGRALPDIPPGGFQAEEELASLPGVRVIDAADVNPGPYLISTRSRGRPRSETCTGLHCV